MKWRSRLLKNSKLVLFILNWFQNIGYNFGLYFRYFLVKFMKISKENLENLKKTFFLLKTI